MWIEIRDEVSGQQQQRAAEQDSISCLCMRIGRREHSSRKTSSRATEHDSEKERGPPYSYIGRKAHDVMVNS